jgi:hypothetical protein
MAYHQEGRCKEATTANEDSSRVTGSEPKYASQYVGALFAFAILYRHTGRCGVGEEDAGESSERL